jgi:LPS-assembly protein
VLRLARVDADSLLEAELVHTRALDADDEVPPLQGTASFERRLPAAGGTLTLGASADGLLRTEGGTGEEARDVLRAGAFAGWRRQAVLAYGVLVETEARAALDAYRITDDPDFGDSLLRATPAAAVTLRWPLLRRGAAGTSDLLEPVVSVGYAGAFGGEPPNEDSRLPELDEANLHALSRLPGEDAVEEGGRLSLGLTWTRVAAGARSTLTFGRLFRTEPFEASETSGLAGTTSDWLLSGRVELAGGLAFDARALFAEDLSLGRTEAAVDWRTEALTLEAAYLNLPADLFEDRPDRVEELSLEAELRASDRWTFRTDARYDLARDRPGRIGVGVVWRNECVEVDVSLARRYTSADGGEASTDFGLSVDLIGFSVGDRPRVEPGACRG